MTAYRVIVADPAWQFDDKLPGDGRGAESNYRCLPIGRVLSFLEDERIEVAGDAVLFLWRVASMQGEALATMARWGFAQKTEVVWQKLTRHGKPWFGMGRYFRGAHETCLVSTRGRCFPDVKNVRSVFAAGVGAHSEKPDAFFDIVDRMYPAGPRIELFARKRRPGWDAVGDELPPWAAGPLPC